MNSSRFRGRPYGSATLIGSVLISQAWAASSSDLRAKEALDSNQKALAGVRTIVVHEILREHLTYDDGWREKSRLEQTHAVLKFRDRRIDVEADKGANPSRLAEIESQVARQLEAIDDRQMLEQVNADITIRRTTTIDMVGRRIRQDDADQRDMQTLVRKHGLAESQRQSLDKTGTTIMNGGKPEIRLHANVGRLATTRPNQSTLRWDTEMLKLGGIPQQVLTDAFELQSQSEASDSFHLIFRDRATKSTRIEFSLAPRLGYAVTRMAFYDGEKLIEEFLSSDFRQVDGTFIPFKTKTVMNTPSPKFYVAEREVKEVILDRPLNDADGLFSIPQGYAVQDLSQTR